MNRRAVLCCALALLTSGCGVSRGPSEAQMRQQQEFINERMRQANEMMESSMRQASEGMAAAQARSDAYAAMTPEEQAAQLKQAREEMRAQREQEEAMQRELRKDPRMARVLDDADREQREEMRRNPSGVHSQFELSDPDEAALGLEMVPALLGQQKLLDDPALQQYVNRVGLWIALQSERPSLPWRFAVIDSDAVNAFAIPGGYVFITRGMLALLGSESELAGVLGHEISHVVRKHHLRWVYQNKDMQASMKTAREQTRRSSSAIAPYLESVERLMQQQQAMMQSGALRAGIGQSEEIQADSDGATLAWRAGYDSYGMVVALQRFEAWQRPRYAALQGELRDHPEPVQRLKMLDVALRTRAEQELVGDAGEERYLKATRGLRDRKS
ncbi:MAG TPA: M48 family metalloprotease [Burkholderiales bacterium]|nr:M48 family metalloprotease [Burkholderiales bacterium]